MENMDFSEALKLLKQGATVRRASWRENKRIMLIQGFHTDSIMPYIAISAKDNKLGVYTALTSDILADDWVRV